MTDIVVGGQYRLRVKPNPEYRCPKCDRIIGLELSDEQRTGCVLVIGIADNWGFGIQQDFSKASGAGCMGFFACPSGLYVVKRNDNGLSFFCPYTWLEPLVEGA